MSVVLILVGCAGALWLLHFSFLCARRYKKLLVKVDELQFNYDKLSFQLFVFEKKSQEYQEYKEKLTG